MRQALMRLALIRQAKHTNDQAGKFPNLQALGQVISLRGPCVLFLILARA